jgi:hypothetical protein
MKERILRITDEIRDNLNQMDDDGVNPKVLQDILDALNQIDEELYTDDMKSYGFNEEEEY